MAPTKPKFTDVLSSHHNHLNPRSQLLLKKEKRKAEESPPKQAGLKRATLGELTNVQVVPPGKSMLTKLTKTLSLKTSTNLTSNVNKDEENAISLPRRNSLIPVAKSKENGVSKAKPTLVKQISLPTIGEKVEKKPLGNHNAVQPTVVKKAEIKKPLPVKPAPKKTAENVPQRTIVTRLSLRKSLESERTENSLYLSALDDLSSESKKSETKKEAENKPPLGVKDFDLSQIKDPINVSVYAMDIFNYLKSREADFEIDDYLTYQKEISKGNRELLVDWMVFVQENYELTHETLYLGVKIVDLFLSKEIIRKSKLQLIGCTGLFIAAKYEERLPPSIDDFQHLCDGLYSIDDILRMEFKILKALDFQLGVPISYRFLRRYARCGEYELKLLTLARYILEYNLMNYEAVTLSDSKQAAAALYMALMMTKKGTWDKTLEYYSGYKLSDFIVICNLFNNYLKKEKHHVLKTVKEKYENRIFFEVAKTPLIANYQLDS